MNLLLLAAGKSSRIYEKIKKNKCLIKISNYTLIKDIIVKSKNSIIKNIYVVTGFKPQNIKKELKKIKNIKYINNDKYHSTDMVYSSILALKKSKSDTLISYTDIFYTKKIFEIFSKSKNQFITIPYIKNWKKIWKLRKKSIFQDAETFRMDKNLNLKEIGKKINQKNLKHINGQFLGVIFIPKKYIKTVINKYKILGNKKLQFTQFINHLIKFKIKIKCVEYSDFWYEFDDYDDLNNFKKLTDINIDNKIK